MPGNKSNKSRKGNQNQVSKLSKQVAVLSVQTRSSCHSGKISADPFPLVKTVSKRITVRVTYASELILLGEIQAAVEAKLHTTLYTYSITDVYVWGTTGASPAECTIRGAILTNNASDSDFSIRDEGSLANRARVRVVIPRNIQKYYKAGELADRQCMKVELDNTVYVSAHVIFDSEDESVKWNDMPPLQIYVVSGKEPKAGTSAKTVEPTPQEFYQLWSEVPEVE